MKKYFNLLWIILYIVPFFLWGCSNSANPVIKKENISHSNFLMAGSGSNLPLTQKLLESYNSLNSTKFQIPKSIGSKGAIKAVSEGAITLGLTSRPLKDEEKKNGLVEIPYARVGIIIGTNLDVPDDTIRYQDLIEIYLGKKKVWQNGKMIVVLAREDGDSTNNTLCKEIPGFKDALTISQNKQSWQTFYTDMEEAQAIVTTPSSIGFTDTSALATQKLKIKPLKVNGIDPTTTNVENGSYKLYKDLYFVYKKPLSQELIKFLKFVSAPQGQAVIRQNGGIPLKGK